MRLTDGRVSDPFGLRALWQQYHDGRELPPAKTHMVRAGVRVGALIFAEQLRRSVTGGHAERWLQKESVEKELASIVGNALRSVARPVQKIEKTCAAVLTVLPAAIQDSLVDHPDGGAQLPRKSIVGRIRPDLIAPLSHWRDDAVAIGTKSQVHSAQWEGQPVAVKVQKPNAKKEITNSFKALYCLSWIHAGWLRRMDHRRVIKFEEERSLLQLSCARERELAKWHFEHWQSHERIHGVEVLSPSQSDFHSTFAWVEGPSIAQFAASASADKRLEVAQLLVEATIGMWLAGKPKFHFHEADFVVKGSDLYVLDDSEVYDHDDIPVLSDFLTSLLENDKDRCAAPMFSQAKPRSSIDFSQIRVRLSSAFYPGSFPL